VVRGREPASCRRGTDCRPMTPTGLPQWNVITSIGAVSGAEARGSGGAHGSVDLPPWSPGPRDWPRWHRPAVVGGTACAPESPRQPRRTRQNDRFWRPALPRPCVPGQQRPSHPPVCAGAHPVGLGRAPPLSGRPGPADIGTSRDEWSTADRDTVEDLVTGRGAACRSPLARSRLAALLVPAHAGQASRVRRGRRR
jgi:hypothetical protein